MVCNLDIYLGVDIMSDINENNQKLRELPSFQAHQIRTLQEKISELEKLVKAGIKDRDILNDRIAELKDRLDQKDKYYNIEHNPAMENDFKWKVGIIDRIINGEEVLRELGDKLVGWQKEKQTDYDKRCFAKSLKNTLAKLNGSGGEE